MAVPTKRADRVRSKASRTRGGLATAPGTQGRANQGVPLMIMVPKETLKALRTGAAERSTTVRVLVLEALLSAGYAVHANQLTDRRRRGGGAGAARCKEDAIANLRQSANVEIDRSRTRTGSRRAASRPTTKGVS
jgi:hypothetical protein